MPLKSEVWLANCYFSTWTHCYAKIPSGVSTFEIRGVAGELLFLQPQGM